MKINVYNLFVFGVFSSLLNAQVGINTVDEAVSLSILENRLGSTQDSILFRSTNSSNEDKFQLKNNGNLTLYNSLMLNNDPGEAENILVSNGNSTQQNWTDSVKKGIDIEVFNAIQDEIIVGLNPTEASQATPFTNPNIIIDSPSIGYWDAINTRYFIIKPGFYSIKIGGNFYRSTVSLSGDFDVGISIFDDNGVLFYQARSSDNYSKNLSTPILSGGINYQQFNAASTSVSLFLKSGYRIRPFYTTGGNASTNANPTYMIPIKTFFDVVYANIEN